LSDKPILFSGPMVRALLDGRKTQTRRILKPRKNACLIDGGWTDDYVLDPGNREWLERHYRFRIGDRLWVKETWQSPALCPPQYRATDTERIGHWDPAVGPWKPSIFMPRCASRLTLSVTGARVQRLQEISEDDAKAEGAIRMVMDDEEKFYERADGTYLCGFAGIWAHINGADSWDANPFVCAISFTVERGNIDSVREAA